MKQAKKILYNLTKLLYEKATITQGEVNHIYRAVTYIIQKDESENSQSTSKLLSLSKKRHKTSQFLKDCYLIQASLTTLNTKIEIYIKDIKDIENNLIKKSDTLESNNEHLQYILRLDCMQSRSYRISEKLEYLHRAYENLIAPYNSLYLPTPNISKRIKTSNLMLFFNKELNSSYRFLAENFFHIKKPKSFSKKEPNGIFSTWNFSTYEHVKDIDDSKREFIALSFWFYEKQIFYPIAYHEIAHSLYMDKDYEKQLQNIKLQSSTKDNISKELLLSQESSFSRSMIYTIYQDIVADFSAYALSGASYILAFFYTGFMQQIHKNFYHDPYVKSEIEQKKVSEDERRCKNQHENLTLLDWAHNQNTSSRDNNFISFYIRIKLLLKLHKMQSGYKMFEDELVGIDDILNFIYPDENYKKEYNTFENILATYEAQSSQYRYTKNFILLLLSLLDVEVFKNKKLHKRVEYTLKNQKKKFNKNKFFKKTIYDHYGDLKYKNFKSQYDLFWQQRFIQMGKQLDDNKSKDKQKNDLQLGRLLRLYNLTKLEIIKESMSLEESIYELTFFKFHTKKGNNPYLNYIEDTKDDCTIIKDTILKDKQITYAFGPYDMALLCQNTTSEVDKFLLDKSKKCTFFTQRHALFELYNSERVETKGKLFKQPFDLHLAIDAKDELSSNAKIFYKRLIHIVQNLNEYYQQVQIFASMGNENYVVYIKGTTLAGIESITSAFYEYDQIKNIVTTILLNEQIRTMQNEQINYDREIVLLCKLKRDGKSHNEILQKTQSVIKGKNLKVYKKYGIFDLLIVPKEGTTFQELTNLLNFINPYIVDVQFEFQSEL